MSAGRSVDLSVTTVSPAQTAEPIVMPFEKWTWVGPRNIKLDGVQVPICEGEILRAKKRLAQDMSGCLYIQSDLAGTAEYGADADGRNRWGTHWRRLLNTIEPSVCGSDAALYQITLCS